MLLEAVEFELFPNTGLEDTVERAVKRILSKPFNRKLIKIETSNKLSFKMPANFLIYHTNLLCSELTTETALHLQLNILRQL